jgi:hypothetical protein
LSDIVEHHRSIKYRVQDYALLTDRFQVVPLTGGRRIEVTGVCPACGGRTSTTWSYGSGNAYKGFLPRRRLGSALIDGPRTLCCDCGHAHADRPDDVIFLGCGAYWQVEVAG